MSSLAGQKLLRAAIQERRFAPAYLLHGDDDFRKSEALKQLIDAAIDPATRDFNLEIRNGAEVDADLLGSLLSTPPMMAERRAVVIRDADALKKPARAAVTAFLERPSPDTLLVLVIASGTKVEDSLLARTVAVSFEPLKPERLNKWVSQQAAQLGGTITPEAVELLIDGAGPDLHQLNVELEKLVSYASGTAIDEDAVTAIVGVRREETLAELLRAVAWRDARRATAIFDGVMQNPKTTAVQVVMALGAQTLALSYACARRERRVPPARLRSELFEFLKSGRSFVGYKWGDAVECWIETAHLWTQDELDRALRLLLATDRALKESRVSSDEQAALTLVLTLCASPAKRKAA